MGVQNVKDKLLEYNAIWRKMHVHENNCILKGAAKMILNLNDAFCHKIIGHDKMFEIFNFSKFSNIRQKDRGDPRVTG